MTWIPIEECIDGGLYKVKARNFKYGVYSEEWEGFYGIRHKFNLVYVDIEYHWDKDFHGTAKPLFFIKECPDDVFNDADKLFEWLKKN